MSRWPPPRCAWAPPPNKDDRLALGIIAEPLGEVEARGPVAARIDHPHDLYHVTHTVDDDVGQAGNNALPRIEHDAGTTKAGVLPQGLRGMPDTSCNLFRGGRAIFRNPAPDLSYVGAGGGEPVDPH